MKKILLVLLTFGMLCGCQGKKEDNVIKIGALLSLTGENAQQGILAKNGILLCVERINANGGVNGKKVDLIIEDTQTSTKGTLNAFKKIVAINSVEAIIVTGDTELQAVNTLADAYKIPIIATICTGMLDENRSKWLFRYCFTEEQEDDYMMNFVKNNLGLSNMALLYPNTLFGQNFYTYSKKYIDQYGINIVADVAYDFNSTDQKGNALKVVSSHPDIICARGFGSSLDALLRYSAELGYSGKIIGDLSITTPSTVNNTLGILEGAYIVASDLDLYSNDMNIISYIKEYRERYKIDPCFWDEIGYDSMLYLCYALHLGQQSQDGFIFAILNNMPEGLLLGNNKFVNSNDVTFDMHMFTMESGKLIKLQ